MGARRDGGAHDVNRVAVLTAVALAVAGVALYVVDDQPRWFQRARYPLRYEEIVTGHARNYRLQPQLLAAVIYQESKFDPEARSSSGAVGLMQLLPETGQGIADRTGGSTWSPADLLNPELNIRYGSWYLRHLLDKYDDERLALAAYNAGQTNVDGWLDRGVDIQFDETRHYVERVQELKGIYAEAYAAELGLR
ncbi:MAG: Lytic transglycosylase catalytic [Gaiellaceae bacterium]|nr:Lytic transglycosylase catalytic [Gaiellaceae bacterium]